MKREGYVARMRTEMNKKGFRREILKKEGY
jgi:hypothetical protein